MMFARWPLGSLLVLGLALLANKPHSENWETLTLDVGQTIHRKITGIDEVNVSRRGVIDIRKEGKATYRITALKSGFVIISFLKPGKPTKNVHINVGKPNQPKKLPDWLCLQSRIKCDHRSTNVWGKAPSLSWWMRAMKFCLKSCFLNVSLSSELKSHLKNRLSQPFFIVNSMKIKNGLVNIQLICQRNLEHFKFFDARLTHLHGAGLIRVQCQQQYRPSFALQARILMVEDQALQTKGLKTSDSISSSRLLGPYNQDTISRLFFQSQNQKSQILGSPFLLLSRGKASELKTGGEVLVSDGYEVDGSKRQSFKSYGVYLKAEILTWTNSMVRCRYNLGLSTPKSGRTSHFSTNLVQGEIDLPFEQVTLVAIVQVEQEIHGHQKPLFLGDIPIIGPLLSYFMDQSAQQNLVALMRIALVVPK